MEFEWDNKKNESNKEKHKISFERAVKVFDDQNKVIYESDSKDYGEKRYLAIGFIFEVLFTVVYTIRDTIHRIISSRRANEKETKIYNEINNKQYENKV